MRIQRPKLDAKTIALICLIAMAGSAAASGTETTHTDSVVVQSNPKLSIDQLNQEKAAKNKAIAEIDYSDVDYFKKKMALTRELLEIEAKIKKFDLTDAESKLKEAKAAHEAAIQNKNQKLPALKKKLADAKTAGVDVATDAHYKAAEQEAGELEKAVLEAKKREDEARSSYAKANKDHKILKVDALTQSKVITEPTNEDKKKHQDFIKSKQDAALEEERKRKETDAHVENHNLFLTGNPVDSITVPEHPTEDQTSAPLTPLQTKLKEKAELEKNFMNLSAEEQDKQREGHNASMKALDADIKKLEFEEAGVELKRAEEALQVATKDHAASESEMQKLQAEQQMSKTDLEAKTETHKKASEEMTKLEADITAKASDFKEGQPFEEAKQIRNAIKNIEKQKLVVAKKIEEAQSAIDAAKQAQEAKVSAVEAVKAKTEQLQTVMNNAQAAKVIAENTFAKAKAEYEHINPTAQPEVHTPLPTTEENVTSNLTEEDQKRDESLKKKKELSESIERLKVEIKELKENLALVNGGIR